MLDIILRTCSRKESQVHGTERIHPKEEITLRCLRSLLRSIEFAKKNFAYKHIKLIIVDDNSDIEIQEKLKNNCDVFIQLKDKNITGNSASLHSIYDYAKTSNYEKNIIYFVEDDYLHEIVAIKEMLDFYLLAKKNMEFTKEICIFPLDCNDRYKSNYLRPCFILPGETRYWRTTDSTTGTFMISKDLLLKHFEIFKMFANYGINPYVHEENTINNIWRDDVNGAICFSPIPTLAYHLQIEEHLPLYTDYLPLWNNSIWEWTYEDILAQAG